MAKVNITKIKQLKGSIKMIEIEGKLYLKWVDNPEAKFLSDSYILAKAENEGIAFKYEDTIIKDCKTLFLIFINEDRENIVNNLHTEEVNMKIDFTK